MRGFGEIEHHNRTIVGRAGSAVLSPESCDVRIESGAADVFSHFIDEENVQIVDRDSWQQGACPLQEFAVCRDELMRMRQLDGIYPSGGTLRDGQPTQDGSLFEDPLGSGNDGGTQTEFVHVRRARLSTAANGQHLAETRLHLPSKGCVRFDSIDDDQVIRF